MKIGTSVNDTPSIMPIITGCDLKNKNSTEIPYISGH